MLTRQDVADFFAWTFDLSYSLLYNESTTHTTIHFDAYLSFICTFYVTVRDSCSFQFLSFRFENWSIFRKDKDKSWRLVLTTDGVMKVDVDDTYEEEQNKEARDVADHSTE